MQLTPCLPVTLAQEQGVAEIIRAARTPGGKASRNATIDLNVKHAACTDYTQFPIMYWALVSVQQQHLKESRAFLF